MKGLSLTQPWATLVAIGAKKIETRSTGFSGRNYRGSLVIHTTREKPRFDLVGVNQLVWMVEALKAAGIRDVTLHTLRHTLATQLEDIGVRPKEVRDIIGHATENSTQHYQHSTRESPRKAMEALEQADPLARGLGGLEVYKRSTEAKSA